MDNRIRHGSNRSGGLAAAPSPCLISCEHSGFGVPIRLCFITTQVTQKKTLQIVSATSTSRQGVRGRSEEHRSASVDWGCRIGQDSFFLFTGQTILHLRHAHPASPHLLLQFPPFRVDRLRVHLQHHWGVLGQASESKSERIYLKSSPVSSETSAAQRPRHAFHAQIQLNGHHRSLPSVR